MPISAMLKQDNLQKINNGWVSGEDCVKYGSGKNRDLYGADSHNLILALNNQDFLYDLYLKGNQKLKTYFSKDYRSKYILNILNQNGIQ